MFLLYCFCIKLNNNFPAFIKAFPYFKKNAVFVHKLYNGFINISKMEDICHCGVTWDSS